jgi:hypothetical protein
MRCLKQESANTITWIGPPESRFTFDHVAGDSVTQVRRIFEDPNPYLVLALGWCLFLHWLASLKDPNLQWVCVHFSKL